MTVDDDTTADDWLAAQWRERRVLSWPDRDDRPRCSWYTLAGHQCRRESVQPYDRDPRVPERTLRFCAQHARDFYQHLNARETEGLAAMREQAITDRWDRRDSDERYEAAARLTEQVKAAAAANPPGPVVTYAMERERWVKIGKSTNVGNRLRSVTQCGSLMPAAMDHHAPVRLLFTLPGDCERALHDQFRRWREPKTEWFRREGAVAEWVADQLAAR